MADSQYGNFQYQFGSLSPIIAAAMQRRQQAQAQSAQMGKVMGLIGAKYGEQSGSAGPGPSDVNNPGYYTQYAADAQQVANPLASVSTDTSGDLPSSGYMRGGVVPRFPHRYAGGGVAQDQDSAQHEQWATAQNPLTPMQMDQNWRAQQAMNEQRRATAMNEQNIAPQHYAGGGVANFGDPYPNENKYLEQFYHLPDVSAISHTIAQQREFQQQLAQQGMQDAYKQATQQMQTQQNNDAANAAMYGMQYPNDPYGGFTDPNRVPDYGGTAALAGQEATQKLNLQQAQEYALGNKGAAAPGYSADSPQIYTDPDTQQQFYRTSRGGWSHLRGSSGGAQGNPYQNSYDMVTTPGQVGFWKPDYSQQISTQEAEAPNSGAMAVMPDGTAVPYADYKKMQTGIVNKYYGSKQGTTPPMGLPSPQTAQPQQPQPQSGQNQQTMPQQRFGSEADARQAGYGSGDTVLLFDPGSKQYRPATLN